MGRNAGSKMFWSHFDDGGSNFVITWYCQQHARFEIETINTDKFISHLETEHGLVEQ